MIDGISSLKDFLAAFAVWTDAQQELERLRSIGELDGVDYARLRAWLAFLATQRADDFRAR
jgi:hypothetical protein